MKKKEIIIGVTASIAAYKTGEVITALKRLNYAINVIMTPDAKHFASLLVFQTLSQNKVYCEPFSLAVKWDPPHISLAEKADLILICPATADIIARLAAGLCDNLLASVVLASKAPVLICPAMNNVMYENKITQDNIARLKKLGFKFIGPIRGRLATGETGMGHLSRVKDIVKAVRKLANG